MEEKIRLLELEIKKLQDMLILVDEYSRHNTSYTLTLLGIIIAVSTAILIGATYFIVKSIINSQVEKEIERKVMSVLSKHPPIYYAKGKATPDENKKIYLSSDIEGIEDLDPNTVMLIETKPKDLTIQQLEGGIYPKLKINEDGIREIEIDNYHEDNGEFNWSLIWIRKKYR